MMDFEDKISASLEKHAQWSGDPDAMWTKVQDEINKKTPRWRGQPFWLGSVVAATIFLVFWIQNVLTPLPPVHNEVPLAPQLRSFAVEFYPLGPLVVNPGEEVTVSLELGGKANVEESSTLSVIDLATGAEIAFEKVKLATLAIPGQVFTTHAPNHPGHYLITIRGTLMVDGQDHVIQGEQELIVQERKDDNNVQQKF